jgi:hypothetical protein
MAQRSAWAEAIEIDGSHLTSAEIASRCSPVRGRCRPRNKGVTRRVGRDDRDQLAVAECLVSAERVVVVKGVTQCGSWDD